MRRLLVVGMAGGLVVIAIGCSTAHPQVEDLGSSDAAVAAFSHSIDDGDGGTVTATVSSKDLPDSGACSCTEYTGGVTWSWPCSYTMCFPWASYSCVANNQIVTDLGCAPTPDQMDAAVAR